MLTVHIHRQSYPSNYVSVHMKAAVVNCLTCESQNVYCFGACWDSTAGTQQMAQGSLQSEAAHVLNPNVKAVLLCAKELQARVHACAKVPSEAAVLC